MVIVVSLGFSIIYFLSYETSIWVARLLSVSAVRHSDGLFTVFFAIIKSKTEFIPFYYDKYQNSVPSDVKSYKRAGPVRYHD